MTDRQLPLAAPSPGAAALRPFAAVRAEIEDDREHQYPTRGTLFVRSRASDRAGRALDGDFTLWVRLPQLRDRIRMVSTDLTSS